MVRTKVTHLKKSASGDAMYSNTDFDNKYSWASSQASSTGGVFEENKFYRLDFSCPHCDNWAYVIGKHFCDNRYIVTYDCIQTYALEHDPSGTEEAYPSVEQQDSPPPPPIPSSGMMEQNEFHTPPTKTSAEMYSEYSKEPLSNIKIAHNGSKRKLFDTDNGDHNDNNSEVTHCDDEKRKKVTERFSKRTRKTLRRYIEEA